MPAQTTDLGEIMGTLTYSQTAHTARTLGATLAQADDARHAAMAGTVDGRMIYNVALFVDSILSARFAAREYVTEGDAR
jgi:hypothetical protein